MRLRGLLAVVVALVVLGASSQAAVCELACGLQVEEMSCHAAASDPEADSAAMGLSHAHCSHGMGASATQQVARVAADCDDASCGHAAMPMLVKRSSTTAASAAVQWAAVAVVQSEPDLTNWGVGVGKRPPSRPGGVGLLR